MLPQTRTHRLSGIGQSYRSLTASQNSHLLRSKSMSLRGITVSQMDAPFSQARSTALWVLSGSIAFTSSSSSFSPSSFSFRVAYTSRCTSASSGVSWDCASILLTSGVLTLIIIIIIIIIYYNDTCILIIIIIRIIIIIITLHYINEVL